MPDKLSLLAWTLLGTGAFATLGGLFGGLAGGLSWKQGRAAGSGLATRMAGALAQLLDRELSTVERGSLIGAVDGALFLGLLGTLVGLTVAHTGGEPGPWVLTALAVTTSLLGGAALFGLLAYGLLGRPLGVLMLGLLGGGIGAFVVARTWGVGHLVPGMVVGLFLGVLIGLVCAARFR